MLEEAVHRDTSLFDLKKIHFTVNLSQFIISGYTLTIYGSAKACLSTCVTCWLSAKTK